MYKHAECPSSSNGYNITYTKTKGLPSKIVLEIGAPVLLTVNDQTCQEY